MLYFLSFATAFLIGAFPTGYLLARIVKKIDIREYGSGNVGATNVSRTLGKGPGIFVLAVDFAKGLLPVIIFSKLFFHNADNQWIAAWIGFAAVIGHVYNPFLGFKGGKGVATGAGAVCAVNPGIFLMAILMWLVIFAITKIVSISSLGSSIAMVISCLFYPMDLKVRIFFALMCLLAFWTHRSNISRLLKGEEQPLVKRPNK